MKENGVESGEMVVSHTDKIRTKNRYFLEDVLKIEFPEFCKWFADLARFGGNIIDAAIIDIQEYKPFTIASVTFFTNLHGYTIKFHKPHATEQEGRASYLGAVVSKRAPRAGEYWTRGSDLADGAYCEETWRRILNDIVAYEMVRLGK